jgi:hypothetical protein
LSNRLPLPPPNWNRQRAEDADSAIAIILSIILIYGIVVLAYRFVRHKTVFAGVVAALVATGSLTSPDGDPEATWLFPVLSVALCLVGLTKVARGLDESQEEALGLLFIGLILSGAVIAVANLAWSGGPPKIANFVMIPIMLFGMLNVVIGWWKFR